MPNQNLKKSERTRIRILDAAARTLARQGYGGTRLEDIAAAIDIKTGSLYYYFSSREELVKEVLEIAISRVGDALKKRMAELPPDATSREKITSAIEMYLMMVLQIDAYAAASFRITRNLPPTLEQRQLELHRTMGNFWRDLLGKAQRSGEIDAKCNLSVLRMLLLGSMNWAIEWYRPGALEVSEIAAHLSEMFFDGVTPKACVSLAASTSPRSSASSRIAPIPRKKRRASSGSSDD